MPFPLFYRVCFIILDICLPFYGIYAHLFAPTLILGSFTPHYVNPPATETQLLLDAIAGFFASLAFLQIVFLYTRPHDLTIWRALEGGTLLVDIFQLGGFTRALIAEGRTDCTLWRSDDWSNIAGYSVIAFIRIAFLMGVGMREQVNRKGKRA